MKRLFKLVFLLLLYLCVSFCKPVSIETAKTVAINWFRDRKDLPPGIVNVKETLLIKEGNDTILYIFNMNPRGFVIVSAEDYIIPVIMYSDENYFRMDDIPPALNAIFNNIKIEILSAKTNKSIQTSEIAEKWKSLFQYNALKKPLKIQGVSPLLSINWAQTAPYNSLCPLAKAPDTHSPVGCVATAMAQIMRYWKWPVKGVGHVRYYHKTFDSLFADFGNTTYDWQNMPDRLYTTSSQQEINAVSQLCYHCGVSVRMDYKVTSSAANSPDARTSLVYYFRYSQDAIYRARKEYTTPNWQNLIVIELLNSRPVYYRGGGHAFILDGYDDQIYFHVNWGWGGSSNGYFSIDKLAVGQYNFNIDDGAIFNIKPDLSPLGPYICTDVDNICFSSVTGQPLPPPQKVFINNPGSSPLNWEITNSSNWIDINPRSGVDNASVSISLKNNSLEPGQYLDTLIIKASGSVNSPQTVYIELLRSLFPKNLNWITKSRGKGNKYINDMCLDKNSNIYISGVLPETLTLNNIKIVSNGSSDILIGKLNSSGNILWLKHFGGIGNDLGTGISCDTNNNILLTGAFSDTIFFDNIKLTSRGNQDAFIVKLNNEGNVLWAKSIGGDSNDISSKIKTDITGNCYIVGSFKKNITIGSQQITSNEKSDLFCAKFDANGNTLWGKNAGGGSFYAGKAIALDNDHNLYFSGDFNGTAKFGDTSITSYGENDIFLAKYNNYGQLRWVRSAGSSYNDNCNGLCLDNKSRIYLSGEFKNYIKFDNVDLTGIGNTDIFICRYDLDGNIKMVKAIGGDYNESGVDICPDSSSNYYIAGLFEKNLNLEGIQLKSYSDFNLFLAKFNAQDNLLWVEQFAGPEKYLSAKTHIDRSYNCAIAGSLICDGKNSDIFIAKMLTNPNKVNTPVKNTPSYGFELSQNYPNPFNPTTNFELNVITPGYYKIKIYNLLGSEVATLASGNFSAGHYKLNWDGTKMPTGIYYAKVISTNSQGTINCSHVKKMMLIK